jgi:hypothetical protein
MSDFPAIIECYSEDAPDDIFTHSLTWDEWRFCPVQTLCEKEATLSQVNFRILTVNGIPWADVGVLTND